MGYITYFDLDIVDGPDGGLTLDEHGEAIGKLSDELYAKSAGTTLRASAPWSPFDEGCKWYTHSEVMVEYSKRYPDTVFLVGGDGEESGDLWKAYYKNGEERHYDAEFQVQSYYKGMFSGVPEKGIFAVINLGAGEPTFYKVKGKVKTFDTEYKAKACAAALGNAQVVELDI